VLHSVGRIKEVLWGHWMAREGNSSI